jgi:ATP synthase protein I
MVSNRCFAVNSSANSPVTVQVSEDTLDTEEPLPAPWSAEQVKAWRQTQRSMPLGVLVAAQFGLGTAAAIIAYVLFGSVVAVSVAYGALCAALPSAVLARGMRSALSRENPVVGFMVWELVKMALGAAMLIAAPKLLETVNWFALLIGLILTLKVVFLAALWPSKASTKPAGDFNN